MDFRIDIRILALSLLFHFGIFALLSVYTEKDIKNVDAIEVVIKDDSEKRTFLPTVKKAEEPVKEDNKTSQFFSEQMQRVKKETIAQDLGSFKNQQKQIARQQKVEAQKVKSNSGPSFLPAQTQASSQEERQSTVNFQVPNLSKGEFTFLNSDFSTYASFYNRITPKIMYNWGNNIDDIALFPHMREKLRKKLRWVTRVELILDNEGHFKDLVIINSSGAPELDHAVHDALLDASPFLNPPTGMIEKDGTVHILGEFSVYTQRPRLAY